MGLGVPTLVGEGGLEHQVHGREVSQIPFTLRGRQQCFLIDGAKHLDGVVIDLIPKLAIEASEKLDAVRMPHPPDIVGQFVERLKRFREIRKHLKSTNRRRCKISHKKSIWNI